MSRRPHRTSLDPSWFKAGAVGKQTASEDEYFRSLDPTVLAIIVDRLVSRLPEPDRSVVQMVTLSRMTYEDCGGFLGHDRKTVWRWEKRGLGLLRAWMTSADWMSELSGGRIPAGEGPPNGADAVGEANTEELV